VNESPAAWSPDGKRVAFSAPNPQGRFQILIRSSDGTGKEEVLHPEPVQQFVNDWSPDGRYILYERGELGASDLYLMSADGKGEPVALVATPAWEKQGAFSPDGRWMTYVSRESGDDEVYVTSYPGGSSKWQVSTHSGWFPRWRRDGKELFYSTVTDNMLTSAQVEARGANFSIGKTQPLFRLRTTTNPGISGAEYDVGLDGQRILVNSLGEAAPQPIALVVNWTAGSEWKQLGSGATR
jgi:Tol biopolymer transport system component